MMSNTQELESVLKKEGFDKQVVNDAMMAAYEDSNPVKFKDDIQEEKKEEVEGKKEADEPLKSEPKKSDDGPDIKMAALAVQNRKLHGKIGELNMKLKQKDTKTTESPERLKAIEDHLEKLKRLEKDFPEEAAAIREQGDLLRQEVKAIKDEFGSKKYLTQEEFNEAINSQMFEFKQKLIVDTKHPGWEDTTQTSEFKEWLEKQGEEVNLLADSDYAHDAIRVLDLYVKSKAQQQAADGKNQRQRDNTAQLRSAVPPTKGGDKGAKSTMTEEDYMMASFRGEI